MSTRLTPIAEVFEEDGWLLKKDVLDVKLIASALDFLKERKQLLQSQFELWAGQKISCDSDYARHQSQFAAYEQQNLPKDLVHYLRGEFDLETRMDARIVGILGDSKIKDFLTAKLGVTEYLIHFPPMIRFKIADSPGSVLPPHQDGPYSQHLRDFLTVWVPLVDIDQQVGGLIMFNGSHRDGVVEHGASGPWSFGVSNAPEKYSRTHVEMKVGDALMFPSLTIHGSAPQLSKTQHRYSIDFRVILSPDDTKKSYFNPFNNQITRLH